MEGMSGIIILVLLAIVALLLFSKSGKVVEDSEKQVAAMGNNTNGEALVLVGEMKIN
jgi:hypothetical protein